jgi:peptidoglycan/xylan/chitin deacetylase (PgdA/CDA1 family)
MFWRRGGLMTLTIDDGPSDRSVELLDALEAAGHRAVFFVLGANAAGREAVLVETLRRGHALGNHSFTHPRFSTITEAQARDELLATEEVIETAYASAGIRRPGRWFRFPYLDTGGEQRNAFQSLLGELGFSVPRSALRRPSILRDDRPTRRDWPTTWPTMDWKRRPVPRFEARAAKARTGDLVEFHDSVYSVANYTAALLRVLARNRLRSTIPT